MEIKKIKCPLLNDHYKKENLEVFVEFYDDSTSPRSIMCPLYQNIPVLKSLGCLELSKDCIYQDWKSLKN
jgi:hypothetical protein